jgi:hypothetical protein
VDTGTDEEGGSVAGTVYINDEDEREKAVDKGDSAVVKGDDILAVENETVYEERPWQGGTPGRRMAEEALSA